MFELMVSVAVALLHFKALKAVTYGVIKRHQASRVTFGDWRNIFRKGRTYISEEKVELIHNLFRRIS